MLKLDTHLPEYVVGIVATGEVDANDYETVFMPALESALNKHKKIRVLYQLTPEFIGFTAGAMWDDAKLGIEHWKAWEKIAVVTDLDWLSHATRMFAFMIPGQVKVFTNKQLTEAEMWITA